MTRNIQQIQQDIANLEASVSTTAISLGQSYIEYLEQITCSVNTQLILASYQICTQIYPESFLKLSLTQRGKLQINLRELAKEMSNYLLSAFENNLSIINNFLEQPEEKLFDFENLLETDALKLENINNSLTRYKNQPISEITNPEDLIQWQKTLEKAINQTLEKISRKANQYLQEAGVLPNKLPGKVIDVALKTEEERGIVNGSPNLLNIMIETGNNQSTDEPIIGKITVLRLALADIEFTESKLSYQRHNIRKILERLQQIRQKYRQKQREKAIAEAELAWRSIWYEEK